MVQRKQLSDGLILTAPRDKLHYLRIALLCLLYHVAVYLNEVDYLLEAVNG